jgi:hypothetical protein
MNTIKYREKYRVYVQLGGGWYPTNELMGKKRRWNTQKNQVGYRLFGVPDNLLVEAAGI